MRTTNVPPIMIVEDRDDDYEATVRALKNDGRLHNNPIRFETAESAMAYLFGWPPYQSGDHPRPAIILLDLNLPGAGGTAMLNKLKEDPQHSDIPVVVLTTSSDRADIERCYKAGANTFVSKPVEAGAFLTAIQSLRDYWFEVAILPGSAK